MDAVEWEYELKRLDRVLNEIRAQLSLQEDETQVSLGKLRNALSSYWDERFAGDEAQHLETVDRERQLHSLSYGKKNRLAKMTEKPYFGRIDFIEEDSALPPEEIYIGIGGLFDSQTDETLIYDWRAPVSSMFYDYEHGLAQYECPIGSVKGEIILKRQYQIRNSILEYMFDCQLKIDDEILQELLSKSVDDKMRTIVSSIQREQNRVIRDELHQLLVVQGVAGSGKTSIALHRVAYLLYQQRNTLTSKNILIFSPNRVFSHYISDVLPELGEENVLQTVFQDFIKSMLLFPNPIKLEGWSDQLDYLLTAAEEASQQAVLSSILYKSSADFAKFITAYAIYLEKYLLDSFPEITYGKSLIFSVDDWRTLWEKLSYLPPSKRLLQIKRRIFKKIRPLVKKLRQRKVEEITVSGEEINQKTIKALARLAVWQELQPLREKINRFTELDTFEIYRRLYKDESIWAKVNSGVNLPKNWSEVCKQTLLRLDQDYLPYEDIIPLLYLQGYFEGFPANNSILHLVIDEAQDYTALQYEILKKLFPRSSWTVLGDLEQTVHPFLNITDFRVIAELFGRGDALLIKLTKSYRSTSEIVEFARSLLPEGEPINHLHRPGSVPEVVQIATPEKIIESIAQKIVEFQGAGYRSIAIICKNNQDSVLVYESLKAQTTVGLITKEESIFKQGVMVMPVYLAKGLEFDAVIVHDVSRDKYYREWERKILYVACTRALHHLTLFYSGQLSPLITSKSSNLYANK